MSLLKRLVARPFSFIKKHWKKLLILLVILGLIGFWQYRQQQKNQPVLTFAHPQRQNLVKTLDVSGVVDAKEKAQLRFAAGGKVVYVGAKEGEFVKKRQTIATIDQATLQRQLQQDLNAYMSERWDWEQTLDNTKDRAIPKSEARDKDQSQWDLTDTVLDVEIRDIAIRNTVLSAPFEGILTHSPLAVPGITLLATDYFEVINPATLIFRAGVDEADIAHVKTGQPASIELDSYPDEFISTQVNYIAYTSSQSSTGTVFVVEFPLSDPQLQKFRFGMSGDVKITLDQRSDVLSIPLTATRRRDNTTYVDVKTGAKTYQEKAIEVGLETDEWIEVTSGLTEQDEILIPE